MNYRPNRWLLALLPLCLLFCAAPRLSAQGITTGTIIGQVVDPQGAVIPNANVAASNTATGVVLHTTSMADGSFSFRAVPIGRYSVKIEAPGFTPATVNDVAVDSGVTADLRTVNVKVGGNMQVVEVNGSAETLLTPTESQVTTTFDTQNMETLPLNNGFDTITEVIPGVVSTHGDNFSNTNGDNFSVNGQSGRNNNFELDGQTNNDNSVAGPQIFFGNQDAIQEIQVITNDYSAQYGRNAGAVVNYVTKAGTNSFHGSAFELYQGQALSAMNNGDKSPLFGYCASGQTPAANGCAAPVLPRFVENRYGATIGGPVLRDKLFFFGSTFWDLLRQGVSPSFSLPDLTPTPAGLASLAAAFPGNPAVAIAKAGGPYGIAAGNPQPIASSITTENITGPNGTTVPVQFAGVSRSIPSLFNDEENMGRLDWQPDANDHFFVRFFYQDQLSTGISGGSIAAGDYVDVPDTNYSVGADWTHTFSPHWVDQLRYAFQESKVAFEGGAIPACTDNNLTACTTDVDFIGTNLDLGLGINPAFPQGRTVKVTQIQDNATWSHGNHTLLFGGEFDYQNSPNVFLPLYNGILLYNTFQDFVQDSGFMELANGNPVIPFTERDVAAYAQDDWKIASHFTAHLGLRWEYFGQAVNELHNETVKRESNPSTAFWDPTLPLADRTVPNVNEVYKNFEPRIGLAWNPGFDQKLVVNAGYAINANPAFYNIFLLDAIASPVANTGAFLCPCLPANGNPTGAGIRSADLANLPHGPGVDPRFRDQTYVPTNFRTPYVQSWTLAIQHQIGHAAVGEVRYVGVKTTQNFQSVNANPYLAPTAAAFPNYSFPSLCSDPNAPGFGRPSCNNANLALVTNGGWQNYSGLGLNLTTQNFHGLSGTFSYTWSREIDNVTDVFGTGAAGSTTAFSQNPLNPNTAERGVDGNSYPSVIGTTFTYQMPKIVKTNGLASKLVNGFTLTSLYRYNSGQPFNPTQPLTLDGNTGDTSFCDGTFNGSSVGPNADTCRLVLSNPKAPLNSVAYLNPYTGPTVGGAPTPGTPAYVEYNSDGFDSSGNYISGTPTTPSANHWIVNNQAYALLVDNPYPGSGRNSLRGDSFSDLDMNLFKDFGITERVKLQLQFDAYNVLNQMFRGTGIAGVENFAPGVSGSTNPFLSTAYNVDGNVSGNSSGQRFFVFGGKILF
jgi:hypothetical protein